MRVDRVVGFGSLVDKLQERIDKAQREYERSSVVVGYTAKYALWVHENREIWPPGMRLAGKPRDPRLWPTKSGKHLDPPRPRKREPHGLFWDPQGGGRPAFLLDPLRENVEMLRHIFLDWIKRGVRPVHALVMTGQQLQRISMMSVPVDTGNLKASAFTEIEHNG